MHPQNHPHALLVIDVQQGLFERPTPIYNAAALLENIHALIAWTRREAGLVVFVQHSNDSILQKYKPAWRLHASLQPQGADLLIHKLHGSAFEGTSLGKELTGRGIQKLVICGLVTHGCVKAGTLDALKQGYQVALVADAHSSYSKDAAKLIQEWNARLEQAGALLRTTQQVTPQA